MYIIKLQIIQCKLIFANNLIICLHFLNNNEELLLISKYYNKIQEF